MQGRAPQLLMPKGVDSKIAFYFSHIGAVSIFCTFGYHDHRMPLFFKASIHLGKEVILNKRNLRQNDEIRGLAVGLAGQAVPAAIQPVWRPPWFR